MENAKTIKVLLFNGTFDGVVIAEQSKWDGILLSSSRESYQTLKKEPQSKFWGIFLLVSDTKVYIGKTNDLIGEITSLFITEKWWKKVIFLTKKDNTLNKSDVNYLEKKFMSLFKIGVTAVVGSVHSRSFDEISRFREIELIDFFSGAQLLLELVGIKINLKNDVNINNKTKPAKSNYATINKGKAIELLKSKYKVDFLDSGITFASLQEDEQVYWANPRVELLSKKWIFILNNQFLRVLTVLVIPPNEMSILEGRKLHTLRIRKDKPYYIDLNLDVDTLIDRRSKQNFSKYVVNVIKYE